jgi:hypothetical protein
MLFLSVHERASLHAQTEGTPTEPAAAKGAAVTLGERPSRKPVDPLVDIIRSLTTDQKNQLMENIKAWQQISPDLKQALRNRDSLLRKKFNDEVDAALGDTPVSTEQRAAFEERYRDERKKVDLALRAELESRRKAALDEVVQRLKKTLTAPKETAPAPAQSSPPTPVP